jgi:hypothetical protein
MYAILHSLKFLIAQSRSNDILRHSIYASLPFLILRKPMIIIVMALDHLRGIPAFLTLKDIFFRNESYNRYHSTM